MKKTVTNISILPFVLLLSSCPGFGVEPECDSNIEKYLYGEELQDEYCEDATLGKALKKMESFRSEVATQVGDDAVAMRSLQYAKIGDISILHKKNNRTSVQNYTGNILAGQPGEYLGMATEARDLGSFQYQFSWKRKYTGDIKTNIELLDLLFKAAYQYEQVSKLTLSIDILDANYTRLKEPLLLISNYEEGLGNTKVQGNVVITGVLTGRLRVSYSAEDNKNRIVDLNSTLVARDINALKGGGVTYAQSADTGATVNIVQESANVDTVFAATYLGIDSDSQDIDAINEHLNRTGGKPIEIYVYQKSYPRVLVSNGQPVVVYKLRQQRWGANPTDQVLWSLLANNISRQSYDVILTMDLYDMRNPNKPKFFYRYQEHIDQFDPGKEVYVGEVLHYRRETNDPNSFKLRLHSVEASFSDNFYGPQ